MGKLIECSCGEPNKAGIIHSENIPCLIISTLTKAAIVETVSAEIVAERAGKKFDELAHEDLSIVSPMNGWGIRWAFIQGSLFAYTELNKLWEYKGDGKNIEEFTEAVSDYRKAVYEFAQSLNPAEFDRMLQYQKLLFEIYRKSLTGKGNQQK